MSVGLETVGERIKTQPSSERCCYPMQDDEELVGSVVGSIRDGNRFLRNVGRRHKKRSPTLTSCEH